MKFYEAAEQARKGKLIRLPYWRNDAVIGVAEVPLSKGIKVFRWYGFDCFGEIPQEKKMPGSLSEEDWEVAD